MNPGKRKRSPSEGESSRSQRPKFGGSRSDAQLHTVSWDARQQQQHGGSAQTDPSEGRSVQISAGPSTSRRAQHHRPPEREEGARWTAPHLRYILPATPLNDVAPQTHYNGSTQGWNLHLSPRSGSAVGAGQVTSTLGGRVEPAMVSTPSLISSQSSGQIATEDGQSDEDAVCLEHPYGGRIYCPPPSPEILQNTRYVRHEQQTLDGACSSGPSQAHTVGPIESSTVYPYPKSPLTQPWEGRLSRYSSLADALDLSMVRYNSTPSPSTSSSPSSLSSLSSPSVSASASSSLAASASASSFAAPSSSLASALSSSSSAPVSLLTSSSVLSDSQAEIHDDIVAPSVGSSDNIEASTRGNSALIDCGTATGEHSIPQMIEGSSQPTGSSSPAPFLPLPSSCELASDIRISMSGVTGNTHANYSLTLSSDVPSLSSLSPPPSPGVPSLVSLSPSSLSPQSGTSPPQRQNMVPAIANHNVDCAVLDALQTPNEEQTDLRTTQQYDSTQNTDVRSPFISSNSGAPPSTIPTASSPSSSEHTSLPEDHERVHDAALLAWLTQNLSSAAFSRLIHGSFLVLPRNSVSNIQMVREAAQRHGVASEDVDEFVERVFSGAIEMAALVDYGIQYEDLEWVIPKGTCSCCRPKE